jgi:hypothetical protein
MKLVAFLGSDKENWGQVSALVNRLDECEQFILVKQKSSPSFPTNHKCKTIEIDSSIPLTKLKENLVTELKQHLSKDFEVALSLASGNGKEHMALISSLLNIPVGIKLVVYTKEGIQFLT